MVIIAVKCNDRTAAINLHAVEWSWVIFNRARALWCLGVTAMSWFWGRCYLLFVTWFELLNSAGPLSVGIWICPWYLSLTKERPCFCFGSVLSWPLTTLISLAQFWERTLGAMTKAGTSAASPASCLHSLCGWEPPLWRSPFLHVPRANPREVICYCQMPQVTSAMYLLNVKHMKNQLFYCFSSQHFKGKN